MTQKTEARASVALDKGETETRCVDDFGGESVTHGALEDPIATLRRELEWLGKRYPQWAAQGGHVTRAAEALDALASKLADASAVTDRVCTILDEAVSMMPVMPAQEALTLLEEHVHSLRMAVEIAQRREPTQAEGGAHARKPDGSLADECFVPAGGWTGRRCRVCNRWVWGGPTACVGCVARREPARLAVPEGELAEQREKLWTLIRNYRGEHVGDLVGVAGAIDRILEPLFGAASAWSSLQLRTEPAPPAPAPGELEEAIAGVDKYIAATCSNEGHHVWDAWEATQRAAESWQRLQWRPASEAPRGVRVLFVGKHEGLRAFVCIGERHEKGQVWLDEDTSNNGGMRIAWRNEEVLGWLPLDALPQLPSTPGAFDA